MPIKSASRSNVLLTLGVLFTLGAATRLIPANFAAANETAEEPAAELVNTTQSAAPASNPTLLSSDGQICFSEDLSGALAADQKRLQTESEKLVERDLELQALAAELEQSRADLTALQTTLETRWQNMQAFAGEDLNHLAQMYGAMKPDQAATIFDQMDPGFAAGFLRLLNSEQAGLIMANMESQQAYIVSVRLASINEDLRREES